MLKVLLMGYFIVSIVDLFLYAYIRLNLKEVFGFMFRISNLLGSPEKVEHMNKNIKEWLESPLSILCVLIPIFNIFLGYIFLHLLKIIKCNKSLK